MIDERAGFRGSPHIPESQISERAPHQRSKPGDKPSGWEKEGTQCKEQWRLRETGSRPRWLAAFVSASGRTCSALMLARISEL